MDAFFARQLAQMHKSQELSGEGWLSCFKVSGLTADKLPSVAQDYQLCQEKALAVFKAKCPYNPDSYDLPYLFGRTIEKLKKVVADQTTPPPQEVTVKILNGCCAQVECMRNVYCESVMIACGLTVLEMSSEGQKTGYV